MAEAFAWLGVDFGGLAGFFGEGAAFGVEGGVVELFAEEEEVLDLFVFLSGARMGA